MNKYLTFAVLAIALALVATGCAAPATPAAPAPAPTGAPIVQTVIVAGTPQVQVITATPAPTSAPSKTTNSLTFAPGVGDVPTTDPALATDTTSSQVVSEVTVPLTRLDEQNGALQPGMANKWEQSADGMTWTFHIDQSLGVKWVKWDNTQQKVVVVQDDNGKDRLVTAKDFEYGIKRLLDPRTASDYATVFANFIKGATEFNSADTKKTSDADMQKLMDAVAVKATDDWTLTIGMVQPTGFFPEIVGLNNMVAEPSWLISDKGDRWVEAGFYQQYGPYVMSDWVHEDHLTMVVNPFWPGTQSVPKPQITTLTLLMIDTGPSLANYEAGKQDISLVPLSDIDRVKADPTLSKEFHIAPSQCTYYIGFNQKKKPFDNAKVRLAFSEAIDRQSIVDNVTKGGQQPANIMIHPGLPGYPDPATYPNLGVKFDAADAKKQLADAGFSDVTKLGEITYMYNTNEGHKKIAEALQQMWQTNLGVTVKLANQEWKVFLKTRQTDAPQIFREGWCMDYPDADTFSRELFDSKVGQAHSEINWTNAEYDSLVEGAARETDPKKRTDAYAKAEQIIAYTDAAVAPIYFYTNVWVSKPYVHRTYGAFGWELFEKWTLDPH